MTTLQGFVLLGCAPFAVYGLMWLTVKCAEDVRAVVHHVRGRHWHWHWH